MAERMLYRALWLFISAYIPLFWILALKYSTSLAQPFVLAAAAIVFILTIGGLIFWLRFLKEINTQTLESYTLLTYRNETTIPLTYLVPYIISLIGFNFSSYADIFAFLILLALLFVVYSNSQFLFLNPAFYIGGYKFYSIEAVSSPSEASNKKLNVLLISKQTRFLPPQEIKARLVVPGILKDAEGA